MIDGPSKSKNEKKGGQQIHVMQTGRDYLAVVCLTQLLFYNVSSTTLLACVEVGYLTVG